jgi:hypothetical protein
LNNLFLFSFLALLSVVSVPSVFAQEQIVISEPLPCFSTTNVTSAYIWLKGCGLDVDYLEFSFLGFEYVTGGRFTMVLSSIFTLVAYVKYHKPEYSIMIGLSFLPITYGFFPGEFLTFAFVMVAMVLTTYGFHILIRQTKG